MSKKFIEPTRMDRFVGGLRGSSTELHLTNNFLRRANIVATMTLI